MLKLTFFPEKISQTANQSSAIRSRRRRVWRELWNNLDNLWIDQRKQTHDLLTQSLRKRSMKIISQLQVYHCNFRSMAESHMWTRRQTKEYKVFYFVYTSGVIIRWIGDARNQTEFELQSFIESIRRSFVDSCWHIRNVLHIIFVYCIRHQIYAWDRHWVFFGFFFSISHLFEGCSRY